MADHLTPEKRSWNMAQIHSTDTSIEVKVRKYLFREGFRYRKNDKRFPGKPDIVLPRYKVVVFIHGCFWHRHEGCKRATTPKSRLDYWNAKFAHNIAKDKENREKVEAMGYRVIVLWECEINKHFEETMSKLVDDLQTYK